MSNNMQKVMAAETAREEASMSVKRAAREAAAELMGQFTTMPFAGYIPPAVVEAFPAQVKIAINDDLDQTLEFYGRLCVNVEHTRAPSQRAALRLLIARVRVMCSILEVDAEDCLAKAEDGNEAAREIRTSCGIRSVV